MQRKNIRISLLHKMKNTPPPSEIFLQQYKKQF